METDVFFSTYQLTKGGALWVRGYRQWVLDIEWGWIWHAISIRT